MERMKPTYDDPDHEEYFQERSAVFQYEYGHPLEYAEWLAMQAVMKKWPPRAVHHGPIGEQYKPLHE